MTSGELKFNPPPGWPESPPGWKPPTSWTPPPNWPPPPEGWQLWIRDDDKLSTQDLNESSYTSVPDKDLSDKDDSVLDDDYLTRIKLLEAENSLLKEKLSVSDLEVIELNDAKVLQEVGIYQYHHPLESASAYKDKLKLLQDQMTEMIREGLAITTSELFTFNNSLSQGRKLSTDLGKLMLRAYNAEAGNAVKSLRAGNVQTALKRLDATRKAIAKLGALMDMEINESFHNLRIEEIHLTADWLMKKQEEREAAREERARLREEQRVQKELEEERKRLDKERMHLLNTLETLRQQGETDENLLQRLTQVDDAIQQNDFRAANIRAGYIYVISNEGAFGSGVVKIGLTRRLEPADRIAELSGASVPFRFDTHTLFFSEDAVTLENELHRHFGSRAVNQTNPRKEFFFATPDEVREVLLDKVGNILEFVEAAEATEFRQSFQSWPEHIRDTRR